MDEPSRMMTPPEESLRKAAILIASLEDATSQSLLESIGDEAAACLREVTVDIESLTDDQQSRILSEFLQALEMEAAGTPDAEGVEIEASLAAKLASEAVVGGGHEQRENAPKRQPDRQSHGASGSVREKHGRSNAEGNISVNFEFGDLNTLSDHALALVFQRADPRVALIALTGASPRLLERIQRQLPWQQGRELRRQLKGLGPVRLSDVEHAQRKLVETTAELIHQRIISPPKNRRFTTAA